MARYADEMNIRKKKLRLKLLATILKRHIWLLVTLRLTVSRCIYSLRKQIILSSLFNDAKYKIVDGKIFLDPFVPYLPSPFFTKLMDNNSLDTFPLKPIHGQISITDHCPCRCSHCHVVNTQSRMLPRDVVFSIIDDMVQLDFPLVFFVGGEPLTRFDDLKEFVRASSRKMDTRIFTSGVGATPERLVELKEAGLEGICVSLDHYKQEIHNERRGYDKAFQYACETIINASGIGLYVSVVCCTTRSMIYSGEIFKMVDFAENLGAHSIQINEIRPVGMALESQDSNFFLTQQDKNILIKYYKEENSSEREIAVVMPWYNEEPDRFGCTATSAQHAYVDVQGNVQPCVLLKASIGNVKESRFYDIWNDFSQRCEHPVKECIIYSYNEIMDNAEALPLAREQTMSVWPSVCEIEATDIFKRIKVKKASERN